MTTSGQEDNEEKRLFFTTSDLLNAVNKNLDELSAPNDTGRPRVELQKRLPDGSTIRANDKDVAGVDMQTKFSQAAAQVACLESTEEKIAWAEQQRQEGNKLYAKGDYAAAMDVYLTCLVAKTGEHEFFVRVFLPTLNNLAQCTLKLKMWSKTEKFCTMAIKEIRENKSTTEKGEYDDKVASAIAKIYFRRAKSRRLQGKYDEARSDLQTALTSLGDKKSQEHQEIEREMEQLERSEIAGKRNEKRQARAMRQALGSGRPDEKQEETAGLWRPDESPLAFQENIRRRKYSTLRAKPETKQIAEEDEEHPLTNKLSCCQYIKSAVGALAEKGLELLGDEERGKRQ